MGVIASLGSYSKQGWPQCGKGFKKGLCISEVPPRRNLGEQAGRSQSCFAGQLRTVRDFLFLFFAAMKEREPEE